MLGFHALVSFLVERGINVDSRDKSGYTALHMAALRGRVAVTRLLLHAGADMGIRNLAGQTALEIAQARDQVDVADLYPRKRSATRPVQKPDAPPIPRQRETSPLSRRKKLFSLSPRDSEDESDSNWSSEEDACFASESDMEGHLSRVSSARSFGGRVRSRAQSVIQQRMPEESDSDGADETRAVSGLGADDDSKAAKSGWLQASSRLLPRLWTSSTQQRSTALASSSPSAQSLSLSSISESSRTQSQPDSEPEEAADWPGSALFGQSGSRYRDDLKSLRASLSRRLGYPLEHLTEDALRSYSYHANKYGHLGRDKMYVKFPC